MPHYMDRHNLPAATADDLAAAHEQDLAVQAHYGVRFLTYWFDPSDGTGICLADAPDASSIQQVHAASHGNEPSDIIEVDLADVAGFLGRTDDPESGSIDGAVRTVVFTDLVDSTSIMQQQGHLAAMAAWDDHTRIVTNAVNAHGGRVVKNTGDGFLLSFDEPGDAVRFAQSVQAELRTYNASGPVLPLRIRVGMNAGLPIERGGDLFGSAVNLAARICAQAGPDESLVSGVVKELCDAGRPAVGFQDRGRVTLKGFVNAVQLYEVTPAPPE